jgi:tetratricopeptide (TPR) repeat protein
LLLTFPDRKSNFLICCKIGKLYEKLNQLPKAIQYFNLAGKVIQKGDNAEFMLTGLFSVYTKMGNMHKADEILKEIRSINPGFKSEDAVKKEIIVYVSEEVKVLLNDAVMLMGQHRFDESLELLFQSLKIQETAVAYHFIGNIYFQEKDNRALGYYEKSYRIDPKDARNLNNLIVSYILAGNFKSATRLLDEYKLVSNDQDKIRKLSDLLEKEKIKQPH